MIIYTSQKTIPLQPVILCYTITYCHLTSSVALSLPANSNRLEQRKGERERPFAEARTTFSRGRSYTHSYSFAYYYLAYKIILHTCYREGKLKNSARVGGFEFRSFSCSSRSGHIPCMGF